jgi:hypothetical protein
MAQTNDGLSIAQELGKIRGYFYTTSTRDNDRAIAANYCELPRARHHRASLTRDMRLASIEEAVRISGFGRALTVREIGALPDLDNITVRIADVAPNLAILGNRFREELGPSTFP